jgi:hypothetical protein
VIAATDPSVAVGVGEQRSGFLLIEVADDRAVVSLGGDREYAGDRGCVLGVPWGGVVVERSDRGQPGVAGARSVPAIVLEVVQEASDQLCVEFVDVERVRLNAGAPLHEGQQQPERVADSP